MLVSIIIPCYNVQEFISTSILSALNQTYLETEIICIDNNSTDNTSSILNDFQIEFPKKIIVLKESKKGAPAARNKGLAIAKGEWIQFLDADDELMPDKILNQVNFISNNPTIELIIASLIKNFVKRKQVLLESLDNVWIGAIVSRAGCTCSNLYKKSALEKINGWDEAKISSQETWLLFSLLKQKCNVAVFHKAETIINERVEGSITFNNRIGNWERYIVFREEIWEYLKSSGLLTPEIETALKQSIFDSIRFSFIEDPKKAVSLYEKYVKEKFKPVESKVTGKHYLRIYNLIGFSILENTKAIIGKYFK
ncbi:MAG TPA: glycosyltransferase family A protein [Bacteroidia bacterium]|jgi:glycosyltransferase involved in cell wall biosynthesis|nr:glycosyltransferase family A protein [Bacteroidia bacterium]